MSESIIKPTHGTKITTASGTYTTVAWGAGTNTCTWTAPQDGDYLVWMIFSMRDATETKMNAYKRIQMGGTATKVLGSILYFDGGGDSAPNNTRMQAREISQPVTATAGQTVYPYIYTNVAGVVYDVKIVAVLL